MSHAPTVAQLINNPRHLCIYHLLKNQAEHTPGAPAILALGRAPLTYRRLYRHIDSAVQMLHIMGLGRNDRVALVLPNGPEMAVAFLAVTTTATCAPLNPAYSTNEFDFYLTGLHAKALIVQSGMDSPAREVARARGLRIIELSPVIEEEAGIFTLTGEKHAPIARHGLAQPDDVALVLPTSGTTSRPKIVPLTHTNVCTAAHNMCVILEIVASDRCLNALPLFYAHALLTSLLTSLVAGASIVCTPGFSVPAFFAWMAEFRPTWYSAVPAIHQEVLARVALHREIIARCPLRFIRSGGASLPPLLMAELETVLNVPVIDSCGMTEVSGLMTCNPLPPRERKAGSVGVAAGPEVAIMDDVGTLLPASESGEIVVRGPSVFHGYDNNPTANESAFIYGWFKTGDQGYLDPDGYLFITGRLKEIINRGGEKIAPREVEEVLMEHPAVAEVAAFAIPHADLGEDIAVAVVLRENALATARKIREFAESRLAHFKVPRQVVFVDEIPKGATGKVQRNSLAAKLGLAAANQIQPEQERIFVAPRDTLELQLIQIWEQIFGIQPIGVTDNFFELGGHSLLAIQLFAHIEKRMGKRLPLATLFQGPTIAHLAHCLCQQGGASSEALPVEIYCDRAVSDPIRHPIAHYLPLKYHPYVRSTYHCLTQSSIARALRSIYIRHGKKIARRFFSYSPIQLVNTLKTMGITAGDTVLMHSAFHVLNGFDETPGQVIECVLNILGESGNLVMVSMPYTRSTAAYLQAGVPFDVQHTMSAMGVITEIFRQKLGVVRSVNPAHPVLALGPEASWIIAEHENTMYSCGKGSPFEKLVHVQAKALFFDVSLRSMTFFHYLEDLFQDTLPVKLYEETPVESTVIDASGKRTAVKTYVFSSDARRYRNMRNLQKEFIKNRVSQSKKVGNTRLTVVHLGQVVECAQRMVRSGTPLWTV